MKLPAATSPQLCLRGPADGQVFAPYEECESSTPPRQFIAAVHHGELCCGAAYEAGEDHDDGECDCLPPSRGLYTLDLDRSIADGARWVYLFECEVFVGDPSDC